MDIMKTAFNEFLELETKHFLLREVKEKDCNDIYDIYSNEEAVRYQQIEPMQSMAQAQKSVNYFFNAFKNKKLIRWCIAEKSSDKVVGLITLHDFDSWNYKAEVGYMLNKKYWRQGIGSEAGQKVIEYAFEIIELHRIEALIHPDNIASIKLSKKLGFKEEGLKEKSAFNRSTGEFEDRLIYGIINNHEK